MSRWSDVESLFERLREATPEERQTLLDAQRDDATVVEVSSLLDAHDEADGFLESPAFEHPDVREERWTQELVDRGAIGPYRITGVLGAGGMGVVLAARQEHPDRDVALKILRGTPWAEDDRYVRLFRREVEALARLEHPDIARIHDAGRTDDGQHWFTMELAKGRPLDAYVAERAPSLKQRLEMFRRICAAVSYAHRRGVIHCDLKPSNVLVADGASGVEIKILDFGLARIVRDGQDAQQSIAGMRGSLQWMSPEQTRVTDDRIDVRADVYALGVMLFELLAGDVPYALEGLAPLEAARVICEQVPRPLPRSLPKDLVTITGSALEKDPDRRYAGADQLAEDLRRWLATEPILARPPSAAYHLLRLFQRHKLLFGAIAVIIGVSLTFAVYASVQAARLQEERDAARRHARVADRLMDWWGNKVLAAIDPTRSPNPQVRMAEVLLARAKDIERDFGDEPVVAATLHHMFARTWQSIGLYPRATFHLERAFELRTEHLGADDTKTVSAMNDLASLLQKVGRGPEAETLYRRALDIRRRRYEPDDHPLLLTSINNLGFILSEQGRHDEARPLLEEAYERRVRELGPHHERTLSSKNNLGSMYIALDQQELAEPILTEVLEERRKLMPEHHPAVVRSVVNLAKLRLLQGRFEDAEKLLGRMRAVTTKALGAENLTTLEVVESQALLYRRRGQSRRALAVQKEVVRLRKQLIGIGSPSTQQAIFKLARLHQQLHQNRESVALLEDLIENHRKHGRPESKLLMESLHALTVHYANIKAYKRARRSAEDAIELLRESLPDDHSSVLVMRSALGAVLMEMGEEEEAVEILEETFAAQRRVNGPEDERTLLTAGHLTRSFQKMRRLDDAERMARQTLEVFTRRRSLRNRHTLVAMRAVATTVMMKEGWTEASKLLRDLVRGMEDVMPDDRDFRAVSVGDLARCEQALGHYEEAERLYREAQGLIANRELHPVVDPDLRKKLAEGLAETLKKLGKPVEAAGDIDG